LKITWCLFQNNNTRYKPTGEPTAKKLR
jgi:hypothetical protein